MKENKVNIELIVPSIGKKYNIFIPVNKTIGELIEILNTSINEMTGGCFPKNNSLNIFNINENTFYECNIEIIKSGIKNGSVLALI